MVLIDMFCPRGRGAVVCLALLLPGLWSTPAAADGDGELPPDRNTLSLPPPKDDDKKTEGLELPPPPGEGDRVDAGDREWSLASPQLAKRQERLALAGTALGASAAMGGLAGWFMLISTSQSTPELKRGWRVAAGVMGVLGGTAMILGTVLWFTAPDAPEQVYLAPQLGGLQLVMHF